MIHIAPAAFTISRCRHSALTALAVAALLATCGLPGASAAQDGAHERGQRHGGERHGERATERHGEWRNDSRAPVAPAAPSGGAVQVRPGQWWDGAHGHAHAYPAQGYAVRGLPAQSRDIYWSGVRYGFHQGVWYAPGPRGYAVVRPPYGVYVPELPLFRTLVVVGGLSYFYLNGVYYRDRVEGGYEVVPAPVVNNLVVETTSALPKVFVYPRLNQSPDTQASDEYECHRWAVTQSGFDPSAAATGSAYVTSTGSADSGRRSDYARARGACLDGRGYTVR